MAVSDTIGKTNITLKLDRALIRSLKVVAAKRGSSISALLAEKVQQLVRDDGEYDKAMNRALALMEESTASGWRKPESRDELHER
jgi:hypothetical protein